MAKKKLRPKGKANPKPQTSNKAKTKSKRKAKKTAQIGWKSPFVWGSMLGIFLITLIVFWGSTKNGFTNWDDQLYVYDNPIIDLSEHSLGEYFTTPIAGNIHPITMLSIALDYSISGKPADIEADAGIYHRTSLIFHLMSTLLVFVFIFLLTKGNWLIALVTALLFGIHPMHVESVAWASGRKDMLYGFFFIAAMIFYLQYMRAKNWLMYGLSFLMFTLSILSKPAAVVFPIVLLLIDYLDQRKFDTKAILDKIIFFALAFTMGVITWQVQDESGAVDVEKYNLAGKFAFASYGFVMYIVKFLVPTKLAAMYPYPTFGSSLTSYYLFIPIAFGIGGATIWAMMKKNSRAIGFSMLFYLFTVILVLQFVTVGSAIMSDRYTYIPYIGLAFLLGFGMDYLIRQKPNLKIPVLAVFSVFAAVLAFATFNRVKVWENSYLLWTNVMENYENAGPAYKNRGKWYFEKQGEILENPQEKKEAYEKALADFNVLVKLKPNDHEGHLSRGNALYKLERYPEAIAEYTKSTQLKGDYMDAWNGLSRTQTDAMIAVKGKVDLEMYKGGLQSFQRMIAMEPNNAQNYYSRGILHRKAGRASEAIKDYNKALQLNPDYYEALSNRGNAYFDLRQYQNAINDYTSSLQMNPNHNSSYMNRASVYIQMGQEGDQTKFDLALADLLKLVEIQPNNIQAYNNISAIYNIKGNQTKAAQYSEKVRQLRSGG